MQTIEKTTLAELVGNEQYARKVLPFMKGEYFADRTERIVFEEIQKFVEKYNALPTKSSLEIEIDTRRDLNEDDIRHVLGVVKELENDKDINFDWLVETTEKFCKDKAVYNAIVEGLNMVSCHIKPNASNPKGGIVESYGSLEDRKIDAESLAKKLEERTALHCNLFFYTMSNAYGWFWTICFFLIFLIKC